MALLRRSLIRASESRWLSQALPRTRLARKAVARFLPGEEPEDALRAAERLARLGMSAVLTHLGENISDRREAEAVRGHYASLLERVAARRLDAQLSVKLTQLGLDVDRDLCRHNLLDLLQRAADHGNFVWIDMEGSAYTDRTLELYREARASHGHVGVCVQAYLYRTAPDLETLLPLSPSIRLVKGAYAEPPHRAYRKKRDVDASFARLLHRLLEAKAADPRLRIGVGTHDERLISRALEEMRALRLEPGAAEFQMLYGIRRDVQQRLAQQGCAVRVLISYGRAWYPWFMRRLAERPANLLFILRNLLPG